MRKTCLKDVLTIQLSCVQKARFINTPYFSVHRLVINNLLIPILSITDATILHSTKLIYLSVIWLFSLFSTYLITITTTLYKYILVIDNSYANLRNTINLKFIISPIYFNCKAGVKEL